jgi:hypothetical protein
VRTCVYREVLVVNTHKIIRTLAKLQYRRTHVVRPSDGKARIVIRNEYMYNVMQCTVA